MTTTQLFLAKWSKMGIYSFDFRSNSVFCFPSSPRHSYDLGGIRMSSWAVPVSRASFLRLLDRHRPVKGVKVLHCVHWLSVKCAFRDDCSPTRGSDIVFGSSSCRLDLNLNATGWRKWQSKIPPRHWCSLPKRGRVMSAISVQLARRTHGWADHSGDSDARSLATNCQKSEQQIRWVRRKTELFVRVAVCAASAAVLATRRGVAGRTRWACGSEMTLILDEWSNSTHRGDGVG